MAVATRSVQGRRKLHFDDYQQLLDDVHALAAAPHRQLGNWSLGQICQHLAVAVDMAVDGPTFQPAWYIRLAGPWLKGRFLSRPMSPGFKLPRRAGTLLPATIDDAQGIDALEKAIARFQQADAFQPHFIFGPLTRREWDQLNFRHAEMHLGFVVPQ